MTREEIASILKSIRIKAGMTQTQVAKALGRKQQTVASWEVGQSQPDANTLFVLCKLYGISVDEAFGFKKSKRSEELENLLTADEALLLRGYRQLTDEGKDSIQRQMVMHLTTYKKVNDLTHMEIAKELA